MFVELAKACLLRKNILFWRKLKIVHLEKKKKRKKMKYGHPVSQYVCLFEVQIAYQSIYVSVSTGQGTYSIIYI